MKTVFLFSLLFSTICGAQNNDSTCIEARWIALSQNEINAPIFGLDSNSAENLDIVNVIKALVLNNRLNMYKHTLVPNGYDKWNHINYEYELEKERISKGLAINSLPYFSFTRPQSDIPLTNEYGEPLTKINLETGYEEFVYPPPEVVEFLARDMDEIRILERKERVQNSDEFVFRPSAISFSVKKENSDGTYEPFWVSLNELFDNLENPEKYSWYKALIHLTYTGFKYKQIACDNETVHDSESYPPILIEVDSNCVAKIPFRYFLNNIRLLIKMPRDCKNELRIEFPTNEMGSFLSCTQQSSEGLKTIEFQIDDKNKIHFGTITKANRGTYNGYFRMGCFKFGRLTLIID